MKRIIAILLTLLLVFSLAACGDNGDNPNGDDPLNRDDGTTQGGNTPGGNTDNPGGNTDNPTIDFGAIMAGNGATNVIWGKESDATKQAIIAAGQKDGLNVTFGNDGSMTVLDPISGDSYVQNPDGTWTFKDADGSLGQLGGDWPDNEFTRLIPNPGFKVLGANTTEDMFEVAFSGVTPDQIRAYVEQVKAAGFNIDAETEDEEVNGVLMYYYTASNAQGYKIHIYQLSITILKP